MQETFKVLYASLATEAEENKSKAASVIAHDHQDLDESFFNSLLVQEKASRWSIARRKLTKLLSMCLRSVKPKTVTATQDPDIRYSDLECCVIAVPHFSENDAVCNDALMIRDCLVKSGMRSYIFSVTWDKGLGKDVLSGVSFLNLLRSPKTLLIYNHCVYWPNGTDYIAKARGPVWFRYHNVTPPEFFVPYDPISAFATRMGRKQTEDIVKTLGSKITRYVPASPFNLQELHEMGANPQALSLLPPFHRLEEFERGLLRGDLQNEIRDGKVNILFVGRIVPNKGFERLLITVRKYVDFYGPNVRMIFAGGLSENFRSYYEHLLSVINTFHLSKIVYWTGKLSFDDLHTFYSCSDVFLLLSEHEGFCLPILEAQLHKVPIIAVEKTAIRDTMGDGQLCFPDFDPDLLATAIHRVVHDKTLREDVIQAGLRNLETYSIETLTASLMEQMS